MTRPVEKGTIRKTWSSTLPVALVYPNVYRVGMANLGFQFLYQCLNSLPRVAAERFFMPTPSTRGNRTNFIHISEESGRPLTEFPLIAFSIPFESDYPAVPQMLLASGIPPLEEERGPSDPVVIGGGVALSLNPEPLAQFLDLIFIGEIDDTPGHERPTFLTLLVETLAKSSSRGLDRRKLRDSFREIPGAYVPSAYSFSYKSDGTIQSIEAESGFPARIPAMIRQSKDLSVPVSVLFSPEAEFGDTLLVETNRGCGRGCRFCAGSWAQFPVRHVEFGRFRRDVDEALTSGRPVGLIGSDLAGHPQLEEIVTHIVERGGRFSLSSIRPEGLTPRMIELLVRGGQKTATLAPEVASSRMKRLIGKEIPSERFYELVEQLVNAGIPSVRFYFMIGLPTETEDDAQALVDFVLESRRVFVNASRARKTIGRIGVQVNPFVPKPWTPFQWAAMQPAKELERRVRLIQEGLRREPNLVLRVESPRQAAIQAFLSRGDRRIATEILNSARNEGKWSGFLRDEAKKLEFYVYRERAAQEIFPWEITSHGIGRGKLRAIYAKAISEGSRDI